MVRGEVLPDRADLLDGMVAYDSGDISVGDRIHSASLKTSQTKIVPCVAQNYGVEVFAFDVLAFLGLLN